MSDLNAIVLDPCCGSRMFHFDKHNAQVVFGDIRQETHTLCDGRKLTISPDEPMDFRALPFPDERFKVVVFDPPHLVRAGESGWQRKKYGALNPTTWRDDIRQGFLECFRVLVPDGVLIFKWNETQIRVREILALTSHKPLVGHPSGRKGGTHWITFLKDKKPGVGASHVRVFSYHFPTPEEPNDD